MISWWTGRETLLPLQWWHIPLEYERRLVFLQVLYKLDLYRTAPALKITL